MKTKLTKIIAIAIISLFGLATINSSPVFATNVCNTNGVADEVKISAGCSDDAGTQLPTTVVNIVTAIIGVCSIIAVIYIVIGGVQYMTSSGDSAKTKQAKNTILYALIGLIICALAFAIVNFVIGSILQQ